MEREEGRERERTEERKVAPTAEDVGLPHGSWKTRTRTHTDAQARKHAHTHVPTHRYTHTVMHSHIHAHTHTFKQTDKRYCVLPSRSPALSFHACRLGRTRTRDSGLFMCIHTYEVCESITAFCVPEGVCVGLCLFACVCSRMCKLEHVEECCVLSRNGCVCVCV